MRDAVSGKRERQERFAKELRGLRAEAGNPSFRVMAAKSRSVSHATLHEAAKGTRFPSWLTTEAFVEACGGDVDDWRARWREALGEPETATREPQTSADAPETPAHTPESTADGSADEGEDLPDGPAVDEPAPAADPVPARRRHRRAALILAGCTAVAAAGTVAYLQPWHGQKTPVRAKPGPQPTAAPTTPAAATPELTIPRVQGDQSLFVADVTIPDGTVVEPGQQFTKTWEIANIGTVPWHGRFLERAALPADNGTCSTPGKVPIPDTKPGAHVRISVPVMAPDTPGSCWVGWKMVDGEDRPFLPGSRPVYFVVNVAR